MGMLLFLRPSLIVATLCARTIAREYNIFLHVILDCVCFCACIMRVNPVMCTSAVETSMRPNIGYRSIHSLLLLLFHIPVWVIVPSMVKPYMEIVLSRYVSELHYYCG